MPRGDGTGPMGNGPLGGGRKNCQGMNSRRAKGLENNNISSTKNESLEEQATRLEEQAKNLRNLAQQNTRNS